ncbi:hypothetical protein [Pseudoxanthomonas beigongshangi]
MTRTNAYTLLCVAIRAVVVWFFCSLLLTLPGLLFSFRHNEFGDDAIWLGLSAVLLPALVLGLAWLFADKLARLALARPQESVFESRIEARTWLGLAFSIIGAYFLFLALRDTVPLLIQWVMLSRATPGSLMLEGDSGPFLIRALTLLIDAALAAVFLLQGPGLARVVHRWRYGRIEQEHADQD